MFRRDQHDIDERTSRVLGRRLNATALFLWLFLIPRVVIAGGLQDVIQSLRSAHLESLTAESSWSATARRQPPEAPTVRPLDGFPALTEELPDRDHFQQLFESGIRHECALVAVGPVADGKRPAQMKRVAFEATWSQAVPDHRVFLSFARADAWGALLVKIVLEMKGYVCFLYIDGAQNEPWVNAVDVGSYFKQAGVHLVIDSAAARHSAAVDAERIALSFLQSDKTSVDQPPLPRMRSTTESERTVTESAGEPCCKLCRYVDGILIECGPIQCGPQCQNARP